MSHRHIFYISDRTGNTAKAIGQSLLSQFDGLEVQSTLLPFTDTAEKVERVARQINEASENSPQKPIVFNTLVDPYHQQIIATTDAVIIDLYHQFTGLLENALQVDSSHATGMVHEKFEYSEYQSRIDAIEYATKYDDGVINKQYEDAKVILLGVSRSGKTPTCIYLAVNFSIKAANYPLTGEVLESGKLPKSLLEHLDKCIGLTLSPNQLYEMRQKRRLGSDYSSLSTCVHEIRLAEKLYDHYNIPTIESTATSVEEISVNILQLKNLTLY